MATSPFFSTNTYTNEQEMLDDLVVEAISIFGIDTYFVTRDFSNPDRTMNEDRLTTFDAAYHIEMYVKSVDGFEGEGDFLSRFGLQIRDQVTFTVAIRTFERHIIRHKPSIKRPNEGDLVYFPMNKKFYKIMHVEHESVFYQSGALYVYDLKCELFEYSNEDFKTGISEIDNHYEKHDTSEITDIEELTKKDPVARNYDFKEKSDLIIDFSETDPFSN